jgi:agmatine/peptidylarginine deiminase
MSTAKFRGGAVMVDGEGEILGQWQCCSQQKRKISCELSTFVFAA